MKIIICNDCGKSRVHCAKGKCKSCYDKPFIRDNLRKRREEDKRLRSLEEEQFI